jgi:hypothetical protein
MLGVIEGDWDSNGGTEGDVVCWLLNTLGGLHDGTEVGNIDIEGPCVGSNVGNLLGEIEDEGDWVGASNGGTEGDNVDSSSDSFG